MSTMEFVGVYFILGCTGALAPEIIRLYRLRNEPQFQWSWYYVFISVIFAGLGGVLAWITPATSLWGAFYIGAATPLIISNIFKDRKQNAPTAAADFTGKGIKKELAINAEMSAEEYLSDEEHFDEFYTDSPVTLKTSEKVTFKQTTRPVNKQIKGFGKIWQNFSNAL